MRKIVLILIVVSLVTGSCSVSRRAGEVEGNGKDEANKKRIAREIVEGNLGKRNFLIRKADVIVAGENFSGKFTCSIRFKTPFSMLISLRSKLGIEVARALVTKDTLLVNDRINRQILTGKPEALERRYGISPSMLLALLGDFIIESADEDRNINCTGTFSNENFKFADRQVKYTFDCRKYKVASGNFEGGLTTGNVFFEYGKFRKISGLYIPGKVVATEDLHDIKLEIEIDDVDVDWQGEIEFIPGAGYEIVYLR